MICRRAVVWLGVGTTVVFRESLDNSIWHYAGLRTKVIVIVYGGSKCTI